LLLRRRERAVAEGGSMLRANETTAAFTLEFEEQVT
jgi:hypothetical protein